MAHAAFSLNALSFFLAFLIVDTLTFPDRPKSAKASSLASSAPSRRSSFSFLSTRPKFFQPRRSASEEGRYLAVPTKSMSTGREKSSSHRRSSSASSTLRSSSILASAAPSLSSWASSLGITQAYKTRTSSEAEIKELAKLREEQERNNKGTLKHYQKKIFEMQVAKALSLQPFIKFILVLLLVGLIATMLLFAFTGADLRSWIAETLIADPARITVSNLRSCFSQLASKAGFLQQHHERTNPTTATSSSAHTLGSFHLQPFSSWNVGRLTARLLPRASAPKPSGLAAPVAAAVDAVRPGTKVVLKAWSMVKDSLSI
ncbi:hypothetical protein CBOM_03320 [Ceraceosorus bombacis]|uniref:Transmembrane protein n=1 Tax=Ceraceosorus bombacis TaxID=401625 RepID=A0A0P1BLJ5_9BASI|nr:hypothetical protein CBOM_03320 [Ceraceosorus bombacis]